MKIDKNTTNLVLHLIDTQGKMVRGRGFEPLNFHFVSPRLRSSKPHAGQEVIFCHYNQRLEYA